MRFDLLLFDADGTLWDFDRSARECLCEVLREKGLPSSDEITETYLKINDDYWKRYERGQEEKSEILVNRFADLLQVLHAEGDPVTLNERYMELLAESCYLIDGADQIIEALSKKLPLYIVTNGTRTAQLGRHERSGLKHCFQKMFISDDMGAAKPDPMFFDRVFEKLPPVDRSRVLLCGDSLRSDMKGGESAGVVNCWYNPRGEKNGRNIRVDYEIKDLKELFQIIG